MTSRRITALLLAGAATLALGLAVDRPSEPAPSPDLVALLDPGKIGAGLCSSRAVRGPGPLAALQRLTITRVALAADEPMPPLYDGLGDRSIAVTTASPEAQRYMDQGLRWMYGFNHAEAVRAFRAAQKLDPDCAMCFWGEALALGPNINLPMEEAALSPAARAMARAVELAPAASEKEQALILALARRYGEGEPAAMDEAYAEAMREIAATYLEDHEVGVLFVEALMNTQPWDYWEADGRTPKGHAGEAIGELERILVAEPNHPAAIHLYIHMLEASTRVAEAEPAADRLGPLMPAAGHLVHMPSHIYYRVGRYLDSLAANEAAVAADAAYVAAAEASAIYASGYYPHNLHFVLVSAQMAGKAEVAIEAAGRLDALIDPEVARRVAWVEAIKTAPYTAHAQLSDPATVLALPDPGGEFPFVRAMWHYARGVALARQGEHDAALAEAEAVALIGRTHDFQAQIEAYLPVPDLLQMAWHLIRARVAQDRGEPEAALADVRAAATIQEALPYLEPPYWYYPVRRTEGALLLAAGRPAEAIDAFMRSLVEAPNDGWALWGLRAAQAAAGDEVAAKVTEALLEKAWAGPMLMPDPMQL